MALTRREFLKWISAGAGATALSGCETTGNATSDLGAAPRGAARVVVIGGGYGGGTAAKYRPDVGAGHRCSAC